MPGRDKTGPQGQGSMTGRRLGGCAGYQENTVANNTIDSTTNAPPMSVNKAVQGQGLGRGFGRGQGGQGLGRGQGRGLGRGQGRGARRSSGK